MRRVIENNNLAGLADILDNEQPDLELYVPGAETYTPLLLAVVQVNVEATRLLLAAGANPDTRARGQLLSPLFQALIDSDEAVIRLLAEAGADLDQIVGADLRMRSAKASTIADALRDRAAELDPEAGVQQLELSAQHSNSRLHWFEGQKQQAINAHRQALSVADVPSITGLTNGDVITQTMMMLTELHEMLLITGQPFTDEEYSHAAHITELGGWHQPLHDMLDIVSAGRDAYPSEQLAAWRTAHGIPQQSNWNFERLNNWVESIDDTDMRDRLFDVLDFFEMGGWQR